MKKVAIYFLVFIFLCFILPALLTKKDIPANAKNTEQQEQQKQGETEINSSELEKKAIGDEIIIKLLHTITGEVEEIKLREYLYNVVSAEMPASFEIEALKAQAIVARTYTAYKMKNKKHENADICDDSKCCQAWISKEDRLSKWDENLREENWKKIVTSVTETADQIVIYNNEPINAFFHSNSGGKTELPVNVWGGENSFPYLQVVETAGEDTYSQYQSEVELTNQELIEKIKNKYEDITIDFNNQEDIKILEYTDSGRVKTIKFGNHEISGTEVRSLLELRSTNFEVAREGEKIKFTVKGYGHGVGMSQTGADSLAKEGKKCEEIIHHFYSGVEIKQQ